MTRGKKVTRQTRWQRRMRHEGRCTICGKPRAPSNRTWCERHAAAQAARHKASYRKAHGGAVEKRTCSECGGLGHNRRSHFRHLPRAHGK